LGKEIRGWNSFFSNLAEQIVLIDPLAGFSFDSVVASDDADD